MKQPEGQYNKWLRLFREQFSNTTVRTSDAGVITNEKVSTRDPRWDRMHHAPRRRRP